MAEKTETPKRQRKPDPYRDKANRVAVLAKKGERLAARAQRLERDLKATQAELKQAKSQHEQAVFALTGVKPPAQEEKAEA